MNPQSMKLLVTRLIIFLFISGASQAAGQTRWQQQEFILGTFYDPPFDVRSRDTVKDGANFRLAKDAGFNLLTGTQDQFRMDHSFEGMKYALSLANKAGLKYMVTDSRMYPVYDFPFQSSVAKTMVEQYKQLAVPLRKTMYAYNLCDEPHHSSEHLKRVTEWKRFFESNDPEKLVYLNLVASYAPNYSWGGFRGKDDGVLDEQERVAYEAYLSSYIDSLRPAVVCFDHYPFFKSGKVRRDYFYNLAIIKKKAGKTPFWAVPMTVDHMAYADPTEAQMSFMYMCPVAYGAKGLIVFTFWELPDREYRLAVVDNSGRPTAKYPILKRLNLWVSRVLGPLVMQLRHLAVIHASRFPDNQQYVEDTINSGSPLVVSLGNDKLMAGVFENSSSYYVLVVNKSLEPITSADLTLKIVVPKVAFAPRVGEIDDVKPIVYTETATRVDPVLKRSIVRIPVIAGGEGIVMRIKK